MKYLKCLILAVFIALPLCVCKVSAASPADLNPAPVETTVTEDVEQDCFRSDDFILVNSPDFEPFAFTGENHLLTILKREGIDGINFYKHTKHDSIIVGKIGDVIVGQVQMDDDDIVWNVRIEKADDFVNNTGIDMSTAQNNLVGCKEYERVVHGKTLITRSYNIDLVDYNELNASIRAGGELNLSHARSVTIEFVLNKTDSILYTFYAERYWVQSGERSIMLPPYERGPAAILKSDADYEMEAKGFTSMYS